LSVQLVSKISNLCDHKSPTSQTDRQTDRRHAMTRPRFALCIVYRAVKSCKTEVACIHGNQLSGGATGKVVEFYSA